MRQGPHPPELLRLMGRAGAGIQHQKKPDPRPAPRSETGGHNERNHPMETIGHQFKTRPKSVADLPDYQRDGHRLAVVDLSSQLYRYPDLGRALMSVLVEAQRAGLTVSDNGTITVPFTDEELGAKVEAAQRNWDATRDRYLAALDDPSSVADYARGMIDRFAASEGLEPISWDSRS